MQHRVRDLLVRQRTQAINALRAHLAELGLVAAQGYDGLKTLLAIVTDVSDTRLPEDARASLSALVAQKPLATAMASKRALILASSFSRSALMEARSKSGRGVTFLMVFPTPPFNETRVEP